MTRRQWTVDLLVNAIVVSVRHRRGLQAFLKEPSRPARTRIRRPARPERATLEADIQIWRPRWIDASRQATG